jgi:hypothetical protein
MSDPKYVIAQCQGGLGKHILFTAFLQVVQKAHPNSKIIVVCAWPELFASLPFVHRVFPLGQTAYFYSEYIKDQNSVIYAQEPYFWSSHVNKTHALIETWCMMYGLTYNGEQPVVKINVEQKKAIRSFYQPRFEGKPFLLIHTNGGLFTSERPYSWARDLPIDVATKVAQHFKKSHFIMQVKRPASPSIEVDGVFVRSEQLSNTELAGIVELTDKRLLIDSSLQHISCAFGLPATVCWNATSPVIFGHKIHENIVAKEKPKKDLPGSYLFDYAFDANEHEFPYEDEDVSNIFDVDQIIDSLEKQTNEPKKGFA